MGRAKKSGVSEIFACVRCMNILRAGDPVEHFQPDWFKYNDTASRCGLHDECDERVLKRRRRHNEEIDRRVRRLREGERLMVIQDQFGAKYDSYGNYYVTVAEGDVEATWKRYQARAKEKGGEGSLVLSDVRRPFLGPRCSCQGTGFVATGMDLTGMETGEMPSIEVRFERCKKGCPGNPERILEWFA